MCILWKFWKRNVVKLNISGDRTIFLIIFIRQDTGSSSSSRPVFMSQWRAYSRAVVFHTLHRVQIDTRLCPYLVYCAPVYPLKLPQLQESSVSTPLLYSSRPSVYASTVAVVVFLAPTRTSSAYSHHCVPNRASPPVLCRLAQVQNQSRRNILRDHILPEPNVKLDMSNEKWKSASHDQYPHIK